MERNPKATSRPKNEAGKPASFGMLKKNDLHEVTITDSNNLGYGVCRIEGTVVFVHGAVVGDVARVKIIKVARDYAVARTEALLTPSPDRTEPLCPAVRTCGGCVYACLTYERECTLKTDYVKNALKKAGLSDVAVAPLLTTGQVTGYRNKVQFPVGEGFTLGYYARHSHDIVPCDACPLHSPVFDPILAEIVAWGKQFAITEVRHIYLRHAKATGQILVCLVSRVRVLAHETELVARLTARSADVASIQININTEDTNVILGRECRLLYGTPEIEDVLCGLRFRLSPLSFYQVNHDAAELLYEKAFSLTEIKAGDRVADLYCGAGTIGLSLIARHPEASLIGVEIVPEAVENARENARRNGITAAKFYCGDAAHPALTEADVILLDPPRKGCSQELIAQVSGIAPRRIVYVSCNPDTLARDLVLFAKEGYEIGEVTPVDLFPRTGHVESVVCLTRKQAKIG